MRTEPTDLSASEVSQRLDEYWGLGQLTLVYVPLGFGSHHWRAVDSAGREWFVTVDDHRDGRMGFPAEASVAGLEQALRTAAALREAARLGYVLAPVPSRSGEVVHLIGDTPYSVALYPFVPAEPVGPGTYPNEADRQAVLGMVGHIHAASQLVPDGLPRREDFVVPDRAALLDVLTRLDEPWASGPYGEPARQLLQTNRESIGVAFAVFDRLVAGLLADQSDWVVTHGEPHARNVLRDGAGDLLLVDWDTAAIGPRERDLWMLVPEPGTQTDGWSAYTAVTGVSRISAEAIRAYRMWWDLSETAGYVAWFRRPHQDTADTATAWGGLSGTFPLRPDYLS